MANSEVTITFSKINVPYIEEHGIVKVLISFTADDTDGSVPNTAFDTSDMVDILGRYCVLAVTNPSTPAPTASYGIEIKDEDGVDIFGAELLSRHTTNAEQTCPKIGSLYGKRVVTNTLSFHLTSNSVNSAVGTCALYFSL